MPDIISRQEAIAQGKTRYFTGKPCGNGHIAERYVKNKNCSECTKIGKRGTNLELKKNGLVRYEDGKACGRGHIAPKYVANNRCVICHRQDRKAQYNGKNIDYVGRPFPRYSMDNKEPVCQVLFKEIADKKISWDYVSEISKISRSTLVKMRHEDGSYGSRMTTIHQIAYAVGATILVRLADGTVIDPQEMINANKSDGDVR